ncbi:Transcription factor bHLH25 [Spatholobus suberectus]|nr:Transcription factor bHLH25 [Spatholobus suberectus]
MEDSWEDLVSHWEMGDDDFFIQSHTSSSNEEESLRNTIVQQPVFYPESDSPSPNIPSSSYLQSNFGAAFAETNLKPHFSFPSGYVLSFVNSVVEPVSTSMERSRCIEPMAHPQTKPRVHILAERKRREELTQSIVALSATIPGLKKTDKANVLREAVKYVKQLQERVKELENQKRKECVDSVILMKKTLLCTNDQATHRCVEELPEVKVTVLDKEVLIGIHCEKEKKSLLKILSLLNDLHLSLTSTSALPFGTTTLKITIIAQVQNI